jgi:hypothetical protein
MVAYQSESENTARQYVSASQTEASDPLLKMYFDSAQYYGQVRAKYLTDHEAAYQKELVSNNKAAIKARESHLQQLQDRSDLYIKKYQDQQKKDEAPSSDSWTQSQNAYAVNTKGFEDASVVLVHVMINPYLVKSGIQDNDQKSLVPQEHLKVPGASFAGLLINKNPPDRHSYDLNYQGYIFQDPGSVATLMFGKYQPADAYHNYRPLFEKNYLTRAGTIGSVRKVKCDVLQNLAFQLEGNPGKIREVISQINWDQVESIMGK